MITGHTVEKIGGTSMSRLGEVLDHVVLGGREGDDLYRRVFVVSAFGGVTNALLSNKKTGAPGVFERFASGEGAWQDELDAVRTLMCEIHHGFESLGLDLERADAFVDERIEGIRTCLHDLMRVRSYGHLHPDNYLPASRELLSAVGEAHSAYIMAEVLQSRGVQARFVDLSCWKQTEILPLETVIERAFEKLDLTSELPIATGYVKCDVGIMTHFNRGYSEYTFSKICALTGAREGIIHKEYHLCTGDPVLMGPDKVQVIGHTNFDIADQMSDMAMEAIHARASKEMEHQEIPLRVKNAFDPEHSGTLITRDYVSPEPKVDMISGREDLLAVEVFDPDMVGQAGYDSRLVGLLEEAGISYIAKNTNANTITHCVPAAPASLEGCLTRMREAFPNAVVRAHPVAIISVLGTHLPFPEVIGKAATALAEAKVDILGLNQATRQVSIQFLVERDQADAAQIALHRALVEQV